MTRLMAEVDAADVAAVSAQALRVRKETVRLISVAKTGHYASTFSCADILAALYHGVLRLRAGEPAWPDRDRFLLGKGHVAVGLYPMLVDWGFLDPTLLDDYARLGSPLGDHPDMTQVPGVDFSSGSLGHALSVGVGMALGGRMAQRDFSVFVLLGDGELNEGQVWEAAMAAAHYRLDALIAIVDRNRFSLDGRVEDVLGIEPLSRKWEAFGWRVQEVDGHDAAQLLSVFRAARESRDGQPTAIIATTVKGKGVAFMESQPGWHLGYLGPQDEEQVLGELGASG
jgi:transketolase